MIVISQFYVNMWATGSESNASARSKLIKAIYYQLPAWASRVDRQFNYPPINSEFLTTCTIITGIGENKILLPVTFADFARFPLHIIAEFEVLNSVL